MYLQGNAVSNQLKALRPRIKHDSHGFDFGELIKQGKRISAVAAVATQDMNRSTSGPSFKYTVSFKVLGMRGFQPWLAKEKPEPKVYRSFDRMLRSLRTRGYRGAITVYQDNEPGSAKSNSIGACASPGLDEFVEA